MFGGFPSLLQVFLGQSLELQLFLCSQMRATSQSIPKEKLDHSVLLLPPKRREGCAEAHNLKPFTLVCYSGPELCNPGSLARAALKGNLWKNPTAKWAPVQTKGAWSHWREIAHKCHGDWSNRFLFACVYFIFWNKNLQGRTNVSCTTASSKTVSN